MGEDRSWRVALVPNTFYLAAKIRSASRSPAHGAKSLGDDHRIQAFRCESFCFVLFSRAADVKQAILAAHGCAFKTSRQDCLRHGRCFAARPAVAPYQLNRRFRGAPDGRALPTKPSAIQQTGIEPIVDRLADLDFFEIGMPGI